MRLAGFHVIVHPDLGIYLGEVEPRPQFAYLPFARHVWSTFPNPFLSAPAYRNIAEVEADTDQLTPGWKLHPVGADLLLGERVAVSMPACIQAGLEAWLCRLTQATECYLRTNAPRAIRHQLEQQAMRGSNRPSLAWTVSPHGLHWRMTPAKPDEASAHNHRDPAFSCN
jgi:hypothetical protein